MPRLLALAALLAAPALASAQPGATTRVGIGVRIGTLPFVTDEFGDFAGFGGPRFSLPVDVNGVVRVEPEFGVSSFTQERGSDERTQRQTSLGLAVSALVPRDDLTLTVGGRVRYARRTQSFGFSPDDEFTATTLAVGPVLGGEYPFSDRFALGAEVGLEYRTFGFDEDQVGDDFSQSGYGTAAALTARFFF